MELACSLKNRTNRSWKTSEECAIGWQIYDPRTGLFIREGEWNALAADVASGEVLKLNLNLDLPPEDGMYRVYVSPIEPVRGWLYSQGDPFLVVDVRVSAGSAVVLSQRETTLQKLRWENFFPALVEMMSAPFRELWRSRDLTTSMARREILARYRGSVGDALWTILHPLLLMLTYFFVFGMVLRSRFENDPSPTGFAFYFLAGMLPWLAFSEPMARAPHVILENRTFVKKLVFPVAILPVSTVLVALVTSLLATALFLIAQFVVRGTIPITALAIPVLLIPQLLMTLGLCWFLAALGVYLRDLSQVMAFVMTLWFFITPICYPESSLPASFIPILSQNPMFQIVRGYRHLLLEGTLPGFMMLVKLWVLSLAVFVLGHAWFSKLRRNFPDVL